MTILLVTADTVCCVGGFKKCFWLLVMAGMASALLYNIVQLTIKYLDHPVSVKLRVDHQPQLKFPSVTVCNMSPVKKSLLQTAENAEVKIRKKRAAGSGSPLTMICIKLESQRCRCCAD